MILRLSHLSDLPGVYEVCHQTGLLGKDASSVISDRTLLGQYFAAPYLVHDPEWCWIAADEHGVAGYLVTTPDSQSFADWMNSDWLPAVRSLHPQKGDSSWTPNEAWIRRTIHEPASVPDWAEAYPAHLHIDFLPRAQGQGLGTRALALFVARLKEKGIAGFHLGVAEANHPAQRFYAKQGLEVLRQEPGVIFFGLRC